MGTSSSRSRSSASCVQGQSGLVETLPQQNKQLNKEKTKETVNTVNRTVVVRSGVRGPLSLLLPGVSDLQL